MTKLSLWNKQEEKRFFTKMLEIATPDQLFYTTNDEKHLAYWPKGYKGKKSTLQSRNTFIGSYTEKWVKDFVTPISEELNAYSVHNVVCDEVGLTNKSPADVAICKTRKTVQRPEDILLLIEVKMSAIWNWEYNSEDGIVECIGDYTTHQGNPGLLRSDSMLKAIGKSINIRVSGFKASKIPIIIIGNTPISENYYSKVDHLKHAGVIQGFYSVNPNPVDNPGNRKNIKNTPDNGFLRFDSFGEFKEVLMQLLRKDSEFFSGMRTKSELGKIIEIANRESSYEEKAEKFLELIRNGDEIGYF
jgi:hypothetical protein